MASALLSLRRILTASNGLRSLPLALAHYPLCSTHRVEPSPAAG